MSFALRFSDLTLGYERHPAIHHLSGEVPTGDLLAVCGPNGAGKSTLLKGIVGILPPLDGSIERVGVGPREIAYLPQAADIDRSFPVTVYDLVSTGLLREAGLFGRIGRGARLRIEEAVSAVGLTGFEGRSIGTLSGGQMQRMLFARLLLQDSPVILLDEPFTAIDDKTTNDLLGLIRRWHSEKRTVIAVLHDFEVVRKHFPRTLLLAREKVAWDATPQALAGENLLKARHMVEAFDTAAHECERAA